VVKFTKEQQTRFRDLVFIHSAVAALYANRQNIINSHAGDHMAKARKRKAVKNATNRLKRKLQEGVRLKRSMGIL